MDPFETFGIEPAFALDPAALEQRFRDLSRVVHPDKFAAAAAGERRRALSRAVDVNAAYRLLRDPVARAHALLARRGSVVDERNQPKASPALLMDVMEQREALAEAKAARDAGRVRVLSKEIGERQESVLARLGEGFADASAESTERLLSLVGELRYLRRFLDEVRAIEEELENA